MRRARDETICLLSVPDGPDAHSPHTRNTWIIGRAEPTIVAAYAAISRESSCDLHQNVSTLQVRCNLGSLSCPEICMLSYRDLYRLSLFRVSKIFSKLIIEFIIYLHIFYLLFIYVYREV